MRFYTKIIGIYKFNELNIGARNKAIEDERDFLLSIMRPLILYPGTRNMTPQKNCRKHMRPNMHIMRLTTILLLNALRPTTTTTTKTVKLLDVMSCSR